MLDTVTGLFQDGRQFPIALLSPGGQESLIVEGLKLRRPLTQDMVQARPPALDTQPGPAIQCDTTDNLLGSKLSQCRQLQAGEDQASTGRHIQELQREGLQSVGDAKIPQWHQDM